MFAATTRRWFVGNGMAVALLLLSGAASSAGIPVVFQSTETPPYWGPSLQDHGMGGAILDLLSAAAGVQPSIEYLPVKRFRSSDAKFIVGDPDLLVQQKQRAIFPIALFRSAFIYYKPHHDKIDIRDIRDLKGHTLGVLRGTLDDKSYFTRNGIQVEESDSDDALIRKLQRGRIDVCIMLDSTGRYFVNKHFPDNQDDFVQVPIPGSVRPIAIMIDVADPQAKLIAKRYQQIFERTLSSKRYLDILENYYGKGNIPTDHRQQLSKFKQYYSVDLNN